MIPITHTLTLASTLFVIGLLGIILNRRHLILVLMSLELMLLAANINFVAFGEYLGDLTGHVMTFFVLTIAAAEVAIGLAILVIYYRQHHQVDVDALSRMKE